MEDIYIYIALGVGLIVGGQYGIVTGIGAALLSVPVTLAVMIVFIFLFKIK